MNRREFIRCAGIGASGMLLASAFDTTMNVRRASAAASSPKADYYVPADIKNLIKGGLSPDKKPVLSVDSGAVVDIETVSMLGIAGTFADYVKRYSLSTDDPIIYRILASEGLKRSCSPGNHVLTGPIRINGAKPGDVLEVRILDTFLTTDFGNVVARPGAGGVPYEVKETTSFRIEYDKAKKVGKYKNLNIPLNPFFGVMGVSPTALAASAPPSVFGGNMDIKALTKGTSVYLPVQVDGALYYTGDAHAAQGDGEVSVTAIETSMTGRVQFILHKNWKLSMPIGETPTHYLVMGLNEELLRASRQAIMEAAHFIAEKNGMSFNEALVLCSMGVDFKVAQVVNGVKGIYGAIPKSLIGAGKLGKFWNEDGAVSYLA
ncbi:acetamidase/formamidase family protein [uncultured Mailhella sp.]|uniref:acetamidase/formamidase family protein n=1 Tax=uncultured Mailhella sp. TaxID=1981031 RepID=UPI003208640C